MASFSSGMKCFRSFLIRSLRYLNGRTLSPFPTEAGQCSESIPQSRTTMKGYERVFRNRLLPQWKNRIALGIEALEVEQWLRVMKKEGGLANPTLDKTRRVMSLVYKHDQDTA